MRVILVVWWLDRFGGMERHVTELACALVRNGVDVLVISEMPLRRPNSYARQLSRAGVRLICGPGALRIANGVRVRCAQPRWEHPAGGSLPELTAGNWLDGWLVRTLEREIAAKLPDALHVHGCRLGQIWLAQWARLRGVRMVYTEHVAIASFGGPLEASAPALALAASALTCVSLDACAQLAAILPEPRPVELLPHIVPAGSADWEESGGVFEVLAPGRLEPHKGGELLLRAFACVAPRYPQSRLIFAGDGPLRRGLASLARELRLRDRVEFPGRLEPASMLAAMRRTGCVALASHTEALPLSILEAMALAKPVVATAVGGIPEVIRHAENGLLVPPGDADALAAVLDSLLADPALRERLGRAARRSFLAGPHCEPAAVGAVLQLYARVASRTREAAV